MRPEDIIGPPPPEGPFRWLRRWFWSLRVSARLALWAGVPLVVVGAVGYWRTAVCVGGGRAWDILIGAGSAHELHAGAWGYVLSAVGWLILPVIAGVIVSSSWEHAIEARQRQGRRQ